MMVTGKGRTVDFRSEADLEDFRDYFDEAVDFGVLEKYRKLLERCTDPEKMRPILERESPVFLPDLE